MPRSLIAVASKIRWMFSFAIPAGAALAVTLMAAVAAQGADPIFSTSTGVVIGPIAFDDSLDGIRRSIPYAEWKNVAVSPFSGRVFGVAARNAVEFGGQGFDVEALHHYYDRSLRLTRAFETESAAECDNVAINWLTELEPMAGPFLSGEPRRTAPSGGGISWSTSRLPNGGVIVTPSPNIATPSRAIDEAVSFGAASSALVTAYDDDNKPIRRKKFASGRVLFYSMESRSARGAASILAEASFSRLDNRCDLTLSISARRSRPDTAYFDFDRAKVARAPSIAEIRFIQDRFDDFTAPVGLRFDCYLSRVTGMPAACKRIGGEEADDEAISADAVRAGEMIAERHVLNLDGVDRDDPASLRVIIPVRVEPTARSDDELASRPRTPLTQLSFSNEPSPSDISMPYSHIRDTARTNVTVKAVCEAQADQSVYCLATLPDKRPDANAFARAAEEALLAYRVAPRLKNGKSSAGAVFDMSVTLAPQQPHPDDVEWPACLLLGEGACRPQNDADRAADPR